MRGLAGEGRSSSFISRSLVGPHISVFPPPFLSSSLGGQIAQNEHGLDFPLTMIMVPLSFVKARSRTRFFIRLLFMRDPSSISLFERIFLFLRLMVCESLCLAPLLGWRAPPPCSCFRCYKIFPRSADHSSIFHD